MKKVLLLIVALAGTVTLSAQNRKGGIDAKLLEEISQGYEGTAADKAIRNALNTTSITVLSANAENAAMIDTEFINCVVV